MLGINQNWIFVLLISILLAISYLIYQQTTIQHAQEQSRLEKEASSKTFRGQKYVPKYNGKGF